MPGFGRYLVTAAEAPAAWTRLSGWGKAVIVLAAVPGVLLGALSAVGLLVSILALLVLVVPAYRLVRILSPARKEPEDTVEVGGMYPSEGRKKIDVTVIE